MKKIDWETLSSIVFVIFVIAVILICLFLKIWVIVNYGDMPITEVPSWAIRWLR